MKFSFCFLSCLLMHNAASLRNREKTTAFLLFVWLTAVFIAGTSLEQKQTINFVFCFSFWNNTSGKCSWEQNQLHKLMKFSLEAKTKFMLLLRLHFLKLLQCMTTNWELNKCMMSRRFSEHERLNYDTGQKSMLSQI